MSIRHVVSWQLSVTDPVEKAAQAARIVEGLEALVGVVDDIRALQVGTDVVGGDNGDVVLIADFDGPDALARYHVHPEHQKVAAFIRSVVAYRMAVDFEL